MTIKCKKKIVWTSLLVANHLALRSRAQGQRSGSRCKVEVKVRGQLQKLGVNVWFILGAQLAEYSKRQSPSSNEPRVTITSLKNLSVSVIVGLMWILLRMRLIAVVDRVLISGTFAMLLQRS